MLSEEPFTLQNDQLRDDIMVFIDSLEDKYFSAAAARQAKMGSVLYRIPHKMASGAAAGVRSLTPPALSSGTAKTPGAGTMRWAFGWCGEGLKRYDCSKQSYRLPL
ncbi:MAG: hypothetical protein HY842_03630 [Bacteroidetes bacterium]|nr:hypothetical protein [Bacteroidota bacterium]